MKTRLKKASSFSVHPCPYSTYGFCVSRDGDEVFLYAMPESASRGIQRYNKTGELLNTWEEKCGFSLVQHILHLSIDNTSYIALSCWGCRSIRLCNMKSTPLLNINSMFLQLNTADLQLNTHTTDSDPITAYRDSKEDQVRPGAMCHGPDNTILVGNWREGREEVLMYDVTSTQFTLKDRFPVHAWKQFDIHYMETAQHGGIIVVCTVGKPNQKVIKAYSIVTKKVVWKTEIGEIHWRVFEPAVMCSDPDTGALYVGDGMNGRLIVIDSNTGEVIQSIQLPGVTHTEGIAWCTVNTHLIMLNYKEDDSHDTYEITFYDIE